MTEKVFRTEEVEGISRRRKTTASDGNNTHRSIAWFGIVHRSIIRVLCTPPSVVSPPSCALVLTDFPVSLLSPRHTYTLYASHYRSPYIPCPKWLPARDNIASPRRASSWRTRSRSGPARNPISSECSRTGRQYCWASGPGKGKKTKTDFTSLLWRQQTGQTYTSYKENRKKKRFRDCRSAIYEWLRVSLFRGMRSITRAETLKSSSRDET